MATKRKFNTKPKTLPDRRREPAFVAHAEWMLRVLGEERETPRPPRTLRGSFENGLRHAVADGNTEAATFLKELLDRADRAEAAKGKG